MKSVTVMLTLMSMYCSAFGQYIDPNNPQYFICSLTPTIYHLKQPCFKATIKAGVTHHVSLCEGGKWKKIREISNQKPCRVCAWPERIDSGFVDIKKLLGKSKEEVIDVCGKGALSHGYGTEFGLSWNPFEVTFKKTENSKRRERVTKIAIGLPDIDFSIKNVSDSFFKKFGLNFEGCKADTIPINRFEKNQRDLPKLPDHILISYRGCVNIEPLDSFDDPDTYFCKIVFAPIERSFKANDLGTLIELSLERKPISPKFPSNSQ